MPPCAATVCERVGNTLVMQAVRKPGFAAADHGAQARAAGADHDDVIGVVFDRIGFVRWWRSPLPLAPLPLPFPPPAMGYTPDDSLRMA